MSELLDTVLKDLGKEHLSLDRFTRIEDMDDSEPWRLIKGLYNSKGATEKITATIINGIATSKKREFLLSKNAIESMLKNDPNATRETINGKEYEALKARLMTGGFLEEREPPTDFDIKNKGKKDLKAGKYRFIHDATSKVIFGSSLCSTPSPTPVSSDDNDYDNETESDNEVDIENNQENISSKEASPPLKVDASIDSYRADLIKKIASKEALRAMSHHNEYLLPEINKLKRELDNLDKVL